MGLALTGALIGLTLLLIVDVHYRMNGGQFVSVGASGDNLGTGSAQQTSAPGGSRTGTGVPTGGGETAEHQYANSKLAHVKGGLGLPAKEDVIKHDKIQYAKPSNVSFLVIK